MTNMMSYWGRADQLPNFWGTKSNKILAELTLQDGWEKVVEIYSKFPQAHTATIKESVGTALHVAIEFNKEEAVKQLVEAIIIEEHRKEEPRTIPEVLEKAINGRGDTPLHVAASRGFAKLCKLIVGPKKQERARLVTVKNYVGETPLFQAALAGSKTAFAYLSHISRDFVKDARDLVRNNQDSILHCAIKREFMDLAVIIVDRYPFLCALTNNDGFTPLKVLATRPSVFRSGCSISWWLLILYHFIFVEPLDVERKMKKFLKELDPPQRPVFPKNYETICELWKRCVGYSTLGKLFGKNPKKDQEHDTEDPQSGFDQRRILEGGFDQRRLEDAFLPPNYATFRQIFKCAYMFALGLPGLGKIIEAKQKHTWSRQLLDALMKDPYEAYTGGGGKPVDFLTGYADEIDPDISRAFRDIEQPVQKETSSQKDLEETKSETKSDTQKASEETKSYTPLLLAARNGIYEMVIEIQRKLPNTLHDTNAKKENLLLVAVLNRQPRVIDKLKKKIPPEVWGNLILAEDKKENTMLHLAAQAQKAKKHKQIAGSALQMMWDMKWYEYIKSLMPKEFYFRSNEDEKTARDIFKETHGELVKDSNEWLKDTSESCSVVAALVAGVSFATAATVPGGNGDNGQPPLKGQPAFDAFAISSLVGLFFSATGLIMFLTILTSRKEARDFRRSLPMKLLLGLSSLFLSIVSMFVSFCSGHFFNVNHKYKDILLPVYAATSFPVAFYAFVQLPLYIDLLTTMFGKVPLAKDKSDTL